MRPPPPLTVSLFATSSLADLVSPRTIQRHAAAGRLVRVRRGVYAEGSEWHRATPEEQYRAVIHAAAMGATDEPVVSHESAAALWGIPFLGVPPAVVHLTVPRATGGRSDPGIRRHCVDLDPADVVAVDGLRVTSIDRTLVDLAAGSRLYSAMVALDAALYADHYRPDPATGQERLLEQWHRMLPFRGHRRARSLIDFAECGAASPSETASRVSIALAGFPAPELQRHFLVDGRDTWADLSWEDGDAIAECDGYSKYSDPGLRGGRTLEEVVMAEKAREDGLRRQVRAFQRWGSTEAFSPVRLRPKLLALGLRPGAPRLRGS